MIRFLISSRFANYSTSKAIKLESNSEETWIPKSWILSEKRENEEDLFCDYWIEIPEAKKSARELILLAYMQFMTREIKFKGEHHSMDGAISYAMTV